MCIRDSYHIARMLHLRGNPEVERISGKIYQETDVDAARKAASGYNVEELGLGLVRLQDGVTLDIETFLDMLKSTDEVPRTSQPPAKDFRRVFELLGTHGYEVLYLGLSHHLSGTFRAGESAAERSENADVQALDTLNASCGQGLLALLAAELAAEDRSREEIVQVIERLVPHTRVMAMPDELDSAVRGGRVPAWVGKLARLLHFTPVLTAKEGRMGLDGAHLGYGADPEKFARRVVKAMVPENTYRVLIAHAGNESGARAMRRSILGGHGKIHSCHITDAGPALGVHLGVGGLVVGFLPEPHRDDASMEAPVHG